MTPGSLGGVILPGDWGGWAGHDQVRLTAFDPCRPLQADSSRSSASVQQCSVNLPDGTCCSVQVRPGTSVREVLQDLCEKLSINLAAVDLFLVGGEKVPIHTASLLAILFK